eukprot:5430498-Lingulodinium_polyedra.AAC.1
MARRADRAEPCRKSCCTGSGRRCVSAQTCTQTFSLMRRPPRRVSASRPTLVSASICASANRSMMLLTAMFSAT